MISVAFLLFPGLGLELLRCKTVAEFSFELELFEIYRLRLLFTLHRLNSPFNVNETLNTKSNAVKRNRPAFYVRLLYRFSLCNVQEQQYARGFSISIR